MKINTTIKKGENSLAIQITGPLKSTLHFTADMSVEIEVSERGLVIHPVIFKKKKLLLLKESQLLKGLTPKKAHADEFFNKINGKDLTHFTLTACNHHLFD